MKEAGDFLLLLIEQFSTKQCVSIPTVIFRILGIFIPINLLFFASFSYIAVNLQKKTIKQYQFTMKFILWSAIALDVLICIYFFLLICL